MNREEIRSVLIDRGYSKQGAEIASLDLTKINEKLKPYLVGWLKNGDETDFAVGEFSVKGLMQRYGYKYPAAQLGINWILEDPETAIPIIKKGIR